MINDEMEEIKARRKDGRCEKDSGGGEGGRDAREGESRVMVGCGVQDVRAFRGRTRDWKVQRRASPA